MDFIFDLYNTLIEIRTDEDRDETWQPVAEFFRSRGLSASPKHLRTLYGEFWKRRLERLEAAGEFDYPELDGTVVFKDIAIVLGGEPEDGFAAEAFKIMRKASIKVLRPFDGTAELLKELRARGARLFVLSNAQSVFTRGEIEECGLGGLFDGIMLSSDHGVRKPDGKFFGLLFEKYGIDKNNAVMVGDEEFSDLGGAAAVGMKSILVKGGAAAHAREISGMAEL